MLLPVVYTQIKATVAPWYMTKFTLCSAQKNIVRFNDGYILVEKTHKPGLSEKALLYVNIKKISFLARLINNNNGLNIIMVTS